MVRSLRWALVVIAVICTVPAGRFAALLLTPTPVRRSTAEAWNARTDAIARARVIVASSPTDISSIDFT